MAGTLLFVSKMYDGVTDPVMGVISDKTHSRWGRRRPYLLVGGVLCAISAVAMFSIPQFSGMLLYAWVLGVLILAATAYTLARVQERGVTAVVGNGQIGILFQEHLNNHR